MLFVTALPAACRHTFDLGDGQGNAIVVEQAVKLRSAAHWHAFLGMIFDYLSLPSLSPKHTAGS